MKIVAYDSPRFKSLFNRLLNRFELGEDAVEKSVRKILDDVRKSGDPAVRKFTKKFDHLDLGKKDFRVTGARIRNAYSDVKPEVIESLKFAADRIRSFHRRQKQESWRYREGEVTLGQLIRPMERAGLYVPGGKAAYPSSLLMNAIPAQVAGVK
ncbi:MAG TPA: histidinol dehydrogenase, partial [Nitrospiria bacterium]|nr:histidinol dehydrogenase [Nitrospiria bacterium]